MLPIECDFRCFSAPQRHVGTSTRSVGGWISPLPQQVIVLGGHFAFDTSSACRQEGICPFWRFATAEKSPVDWVYGTLNGDGILPGVRPVSLFRGAPKLKFISSAAAQGYMASFSTTWSNWRMLLISLSPDIARRPDLHTSSIGQADG